MKPIECPFEAEILEAALHARMDAGLREHARICPICSDVAAVASAIDQTREEMRGTFTVPDSGRVWWLARLRARREAAEAASRAITATQVVALTCAVGLLGACFGATSIWFQSLLQAVTACLAGISLETLPAMLGMALVLFVVPAALYLAIGKD